MRAQYSPSNLVSEGLGWDNSDFFANPFVGVVVQRKAGVILLNDDLSGLFDCLGTYATLENTKH